MEEAQDFVDQRRVQMFNLWQQNFEMGKKVYLEKKDELSPEEQATIEAEIAKNEELVAEYRAKYGVEDVPSEDVPQLDS
jgi:hypothetical protein